MRARAWNLLLDAWGWAFEQSGFSWKTWRELSAGMRAEGLHGYRKEPRR